MTAQALPIPESPLESSISARQRSRLDSNTPCHDSLLSTELAGGLVKLEAILSFLLQGDRFLTHLRLDTDGLAFVSLRVNGEGIGTGVGTVVGRLVGRGFSLKEGRSDFAGVFSRLEMGRTLTESETESTADWTVCLMDSMIVIIWVMILHGNQKEICPCRLYIPPAHFAIPRCRLQNS
jgi:hypothetical protein